jgi:cytoskeleton protein RodZ
MNELDSISEPDELPRVSIMLVEARTAKRLSQEDVASQLFLTATIIRQMDEGLFHVMSKPAYVRGYLRTYAKVIGLSGDDVIEAFNETQVVEVDASEVHELIEAPSSANRFTGSVVQTGLIGLGLILLVMILVWAFSSDEEEQVGYRPDHIEAPAAEVGQPEPAGVQDSEPLLGGVKVSSDAAIEVSTDTESETPVTVLTSTAVRAKPVAIKSTPVRAKPVAIKSTPVQSPVVSQAQGPQAEVASAEVASAEGQSSLLERKADNAVADIVATTSMDDEPEQLLVSDASITRVRQGAASLITVSTAGDDTLEINFTDECWVEVSNAAGDQIYGDLNRAGDTLVVVGRAPFEVLFGKAPAAQLVFNGQGISLDRYTADDLTAKIKLPR